MTHPDVGASTTQLAELARVVIGLGQQTTTTHGSMVAAVAHAAAAHIPGARWASITVATHPRLRTLAASAPVAQHADALQEDITAPAMAPNPAPMLQVSQDLAQERRWSGMGPRMHHRLGLRSLLTHRLHLAGEPETVASLNLYSDAPGAFEESAAWGAGLLGAHGALAVSAQLAEQRATRLERSLPRTREIGVAVGVLMARYGSTREEALELLRRAGQESHRPVAAIAAEVVDSEIQRLPPMPTSLGAPWNHTPPS